MPKKSIQKKGTPVNGPPAIAFGSGQWRAGLSGTHSLIDTTKGPAYAGPLESAMVVQRGIRSFRSRLAAFKGEFRKTV